MTTETVISTQHHGVGPDKFSFDCAITNRTRNESDLLLPGEAPVSSSFRVALTGISISGNLESVGNYIQEVHVKRIPSDPTATQASIGEGYAHTLYSQDGKPLFKKLLPLGADASFKAPLTSIDTRVSQKPRGDDDTSRDASNVAAPSELTEK